MISNYTGVSGSRIAYLAAAELKRNRTALIVVSTRRVAERLAEDLAFFAPEAEILIMPEEENTHILYEARDRAGLADRIRAIQALSSSGENCVAVIAPVSAVLKPTVDPGRFIRSVLTVKMGDEIEPSDLKARLYANGYQSSVVTESSGEFSSRGGILDVFPPGMANPVRIEFFGDEIDSIRTFDTETQRSIENLMEVTLSPAAEFVPTPEEIEEALERIEKDYDKKIRKAEKSLKTGTSGQAEKDVQAGSGSESGEDASSSEVAEDPEVIAYRVDKLKEQKRRISEMFQLSSNVQQYADFIDYFGLEKHYLWDHLKDGVCLICDPPRIISEVPDFQDPEAFKQIYSAACTNDGAKDGVKDNRDGAKDGANTGTNGGARNCVIYTPFAQTLQGVDRLDRIVNVKSRQVAVFNGQIDLFANEVQEYTSNGYAVNIVSGSKVRQDLVREYLTIADIHGNINYFIGNLSSGMVFDDDKAVYITEGDIFTQSRRAAPPRKPKKSRNSLQFSDLHEGDYVVHETHGIGKFEGIRPLTADGQTRDYLVIRYAGTDVLYIPTEQLDIIQKYIGSAGKAPSLSRLSGGSWRRTRERVRRAVMEIAEDLVQLYAAREAAGGYAFSADGPWQQEFESDFIYTETSDQLQAISEIKEDMERAVPMDRLLCGDVGYGKTEVAARAIFKCISEGKQAAVLAPTTLLVNQHYHNLRERFAAFEAIDIRELSRFRSPEQQAETIEDLKRGSVDLVIGTHRLLSKDVAFKDLGLLVIDEEQRFGVQHKEQIKKLKNNIDVLTLSATPIPRTLNMSLTGIKDISTINEPPGDRYPVQTYVSPYDEDAVRNAITRELARGGQVFVVRNRVNGINTIAKEIEKLVPEARVCVGHGRMSEETLENTMLAFMEGEYNVLVATTIIENGIDIPNANTIIILDADCLGLSQLYQLRGRVGRSSRIAYAYLMYKPNKVLTEIATKRLAAIREFTEFGAGFKVAMKDLELRGAGNILGEDQSGHVEGIGYELYVKEIDRAVRRLKGETVTETRADITIDIKIPASIPREYITEETLRLQAYKKIAGITCEEDYNDMYDELSDRYGDLPEDVSNLLLIAEVRAHAEAIGLESIAERGKRIVRKFAENTKVNAYMLVMAKSEIGDALTITGGNIPSLSLFTGGKFPLDKLNTLMRSMRNAMESSQDLQKQI